MLLGRDAKLADAVFLKLCIRHQRNQRYGTGLLERFQAFSESAALGVRTRRENQCARSMGHRFQ